MQSYLFGNDHFRLRRREQALVKAFQAIHPDCEQQVVDGRDSAEGIIMKLRDTLASGLFAQSKVILLRHTELFDEKMSEAIVRILPSADTTDTLIIGSAELSGRVKKDNPLQSWFVRHAENEEVKMHGGRALTQLITLWLEEIDPKAQMEPRAVEVLASQTGGSTGRIYHELLKLVLVSQGKPIHEADVLSLTKRIAEENVAFALLDALVQGNRERALPLLRREEKREDEVFKLLGLFAWQVRQAIMVRDEYDRGVTSPEAIATAIGAKPFSVRKLLPLISTFPLARLKRALSLLSDLDRAIKTGQARPGVALDLFVWKF